MSLFLLPLLTGIAHADPPLALGLATRCPPLCLHLQDLDTEIEPGDWIAETDKALQPFGLNSLLVYVTVLTGKIDVTVGDVQMNEKNLVGYRDGAAVYQIPVPKDGFKVVVRNLGELDAGYDVQVAGSPLDPR